LQIRYVFQVYWTLARPILYSSANLLQIPARESSIANKSIITNISKHQEQIMAVGERGHILTWTDMDNWQQQNVPVSLTLTDMTILDDGTKFAVG
jgi:photosystem II stability/assembly factor-like uncharacterized protein